MRYLDIAAAALIGMSSLTGILAWSPYQGDDAAARLALQASMEDQLLSIVEHRGVGWLLQSPMDIICQYLVSLSNSTVRFSASVGSESCGSPPSSASVRANLTLRLTPGDVVLAAWAPG